MAKKDSKRCLGCMSLLETVTEECPRCGYSKKSENDAEYLRPGRTLSGGRYLVGKLARENGESAYYVGYDNNEKCTCWIREYFPTKLARRVRSKGLVTPLDGADAQYKSLLSDFIDLCNEVKRLGVTEKVVPILATFTENNTVYAIYEHLRLTSFDEYLSQNGGKLPLNKAINLLLPLFNMVATIHDHGHIHRGISPYTVYADENGSLFLWDFSIGAARTSGSELDAELYNGYSAPEQYSPSGWQGNWTDIYALAAMFYRTVSGFVPPKSTFVGEDRHMAPLSDLVIDMPQNISDAVEKAMLPSTEKRTQAVYKFTSELLEGDGEGTAVYDTSETKLAPVRSERAHQRDSGFKYTVLALAVTVLLLVGGLWYIMTKYFPNMVSETDEKASSYNLDDIIDNSVPSFESDSESNPESSSQSSDIDTPRFVGQMLSAIENDVYYKSSFVFEVEEEFNSEFPEGVVFKQTPPADTAIEPGSKVTLYVSKGTDEIAVMPNVIGLDYAEARDALQKLNVPVEKVERHATGAVAGSVVGTLPAPGTAISSKDVVTVYVMPGSSPSASASSTAPTSSKPSSESSSTSSKQSNAESSVSSKTSSSSKSSSSSKASSSSN